MSLIDLRAALEAERFESARRIGIALLARATEDRGEVVLALHDALAKLGEISEARQLLENESTALQHHRFAAAMRLANDLRKLISYDHYRVSDEVALGLSYDEYLEILRQCTFEASQRAKKEATSKTQLAEWNAANQPSVAEPFSGASRLQITEPAQTQSGGDLVGRIHLADGSPVADAIVSLGLKIEVLVPDPKTFVDRSMGCHPGIGPLSKLTAQTDADGAFSFQHVPPGTHEFLAVTLDPLRWDVPTRFLLRSLEVTEADILDVGCLTIADWQSAASRDFVSPHPDSFEEDDVRWEKVTEWRLHNPFHYDFRRQPLELPVPGTTVTGRLRILPGRDEAFQIVEDQIHFLTDLPARTDRVVAWYSADTTNFSPPTPTSPVQLLRESDTSWVLDTGVAAFRIAGDGGCAAAAPIQAVRAADGVWRGEGRFRLPAGITIVARTTRILVEGPVLTTIEQHYSLSNGATYRLNLTAHAGEPLLVVKEWAESLSDAAFEFSLREFVGGRGFLHWTPETGSRHWSSLKAEDTTLALLPESVPWWIPPQGFGYAMTPDGLDQRDYIGVITLRRGDWIDREFERLAQGPIDADGKENRELDWPHPEMVGSSISMIRAFTNVDGDAFFQFGFFDGERQWAILASSFDRNDGPNKEIGRIQHAWSSPRLQDFKDWQFDLPDTRLRPQLVTQRECLIPLRRKATNPQFAALWEKIATNDVPGASQGLTFAVDNDPLIAWFKRIELLHEAGMRSKMSLLGRDWSDIYSPVGGRNITTLAEEYDLIAASGVFTEEEERTVRAFLLLMGHLYMETDFMNWRFNGRNANFEADRTDIVGAVGLAFPGHPDAAKMIAHVVERTRSSLLAYCTPGSGRWYENPACYYLHASKCRMNLVYHLSHKGQLDLASVPRLKDFLRWGIILLTPPLPVSYQVLRDGDEAAFRRTEKIRKVPPIGDHASVGRWLPEHYFLLGKLFARVDPEFGQELVNAYFVANGDGRRLADPAGAAIEQAGEQLFHDVSAGSSFGNLPLLFASIEAKDVPVQPAVRLVSRRLEGFGAVFRNRVNTAEEDYLLIKQGPGGYRYHRTEGSFLLIAGGRPLVFDGGEAGETWRHSTLSFFDVHMPMAAGRVERFFDGPGFQFSQGIHPEIIAPGEPVFLSDSCEHTLVAESYRRFNKPNPAVTRSFAWVDNDYLVIHDALDLAETPPSHWHLQVVGSAPTGSAALGYTFPGRFGLDLHVQLPGQDFDAEQHDPLPIHEYNSKPAECFTMHHLQLSKQNAKDYLAVLRPVKSDRDEKLTSQSVRHNGRIVGARVAGGNCDDLLFFDRRGLEYTAGNLEFSGSYGAMLKRAASTRLILLGSGEWRVDDVTLTSTGPFVSFEILAESLTLHAEGEGQIGVKLGSLDREFTVTPEAHFKFTTIRPH